MSSHGKRPDMARVSECPTCGHSFVVRADGAFYCTICDRDWWPLEALVDTSGIDWYTYPPGTQS